MMKRFILLLFLLTAGHFSSSAQDEFLQLDYACKKGHPSFSKVNIIDVRPPNQTLGFVQVGALNRIAEVKFKGSFRDSLAAYFLQHNESIIQRPELTIILYEMYVSEKTEGMSETGRLKLSMRFFSGNENGQFTEVYAIDTVYEFGAFDVTKKLLHSISDWMCTISADLEGGVKTVDDSAVSYTLDELNKLDSLEKLKLPVYADPAVHAGIFYDYDKFKMNTPDSSASVEIDTSDPEHVKAYEWNKKKTKKSKIDFHTVYAVSDGHTTVKATAYGFYVLKKIGSDFYFTGQTSFTNMYNSAMWGVMFGMVGAAIAENVNVSRNLFRFKINYLKGNSIPLSKLE